MIRKTIFILFSVLLIMSCDNDESNGGGNSNTPDPSQTFGSVSATINGSSYESSEVVSRYRSSGGFIIKASDEEGRSFKFVLDNFLGNATYNIGPGLSGTCTYTDVVNGAPVEFVNGTGSIIVSDYNESENSFNADFNIVLLSTVSPGITADADGSFSNLGILDISEPQNGETVLFWNDQEHYNTYDANSRVSYLNVLKAEFSKEGSSTELQVSLDNATDPEFIRYRDNFSWFGFSSSTNEILAWNFNSDELTVSGHLKSLDVGDYEIWFSNIPIEEIPEFDLSIGETVFFNGEDTLEFDEGTFTVIPGPSFFYSFECTNQAGQKLYFEYEDDSEPVPNPPVTPLGRSVVLEYYADENNSFPTSSYFGKYLTNSREGEPDKRDVFFESNDGEQFIRARGVDEIF